MKFVKSAFVPVIAASALMLGGCFGGDVEKINSYIEKTEAFDGGSIDYEKKEYKSEYWDMNLVFDDSWNIHTEQQLEYLASTSYDSMLNAGLTALESENASEEYLQAYEKSVQIIPEFAADYYEGEALCGTVIGYSVAKYSGETESVENVVAGMKDFIEENTAEDFQVTAGGETYIGVKGVMTRYNEGTNGVILSREKDGVYLVIMIGYYDDGSVIDEFFDMIEKQ